MLVERVTIKENLVRENTVKGGLRMIVKTKTMRVVTEIS
jgi:hypothetical protein